MANPKIKFKRSSVEGKRPDNSSLDLGEIAVNTYDGRIYLKRDTSGEDIDGIKLVNPWIENNANTGIACTYPIQISGLTTFTQNVHLLDSDKLLFGAGEDLEIYHDGSHSYISDQGQGNLKVLSNNIRFTNPDESKVSATFDATGDVDLYYNNDLRFSTTGIGVTIWGETETRTLNVSGVSTFGSNIISSGIITATQFIGDGSGLSNIVGTGTGVYIQVNDTQIGAASTLAFSGNLSATVSAGIATITVPTTSLVRQSFTATVNQTSFTVAGGYTDGYIDIHLNGVKLNVGTDVTANDESTIVLSVGASAGDVIETTVFKTLQISPDTNIRKEVVNITDNTSSINVTSGYNIGHLDVYLNGLKLIDGTDFTATNGTSVSLTRAAVDGDTVEFVAVRTLNSIPGAGIGTDGSVNTVGIITAASFYGDGSNLTGIFGLVSVTNQLYVTPDGNDENDGYLVSTAKRTVGSALTVATPSTVVNISAGTYVENNPIILPEQVTLLGDSLREVSIVPQNKNADLIYVANGSYVENMSFTGTLNEGKAIISFNPDQPSFVTQGPYIRNCTNFISNSIGMKIDGDDVIGPTKAMNVDSYTQLNQGGIGVSISNGGYAQLVSIFTIYNDQSIVCIDGGQCDLTNSNSSFGRLGLVADGIGPTNFIGTVTEFTSAGSNVFPIDISTETLSIENAEYDNVTGLTTVTTSTNHDFNVGMSVTMKDMIFTCDSQLPITSFGISTANYSNVTGIMTVTTSVGNNFYVGASVTFSQLVFSCDSGGGVSTAFFPPAFGAGNGAARHVFDVLSIGSSTEFTVNVGPSTIVHNYQTGGNVSISTFAPFPSGAFGNIFTVDSVVGPTTFTAYVGVSTLSHTYVSGGEAETFVTRPFDGQVVYLDNVYNTIKDVTITDGGSGYTQAPTVTFSDPSESWGVKATGVARLTGDTVTSIDMISNGRGYTGNPTVTISGSATGVPNNLPTYYVVSSATPVVGGITTVTFTENVPYAVGVGTTVPFFKQSRILASSHAFEYIGSGNTFPNALPARGGVAIPENEIVNLNGGLVIFTSTDQAGNFNIGEGVVINQLEGSITGNAYKGSLFANITPYILALGGD